MRPGPAAAAPLVAALLSSVAALSPHTASAAGAAPSLTFLSQTDVPVTATFGGTVIGGLSGIDYSAGSGTFVSIADHGYRGATPQYYTLVPTFAAGRPGYGLSFTGVTPLGQDNTESIRFDPRGDGVWYTTEESVPGIYHREVNGSTIQLPTPANIAARSQDNYSLEGSTFLPDGRLVVSMENALQGDSPDLTRLTVLDRTGAVDAQYAYHLDRLPGIANPPEMIGSTNNGVSEVLSLGDGSLLVLERAFNGGASTDPNTSNNSIRIYRVDLDGATDIRNVTDLGTGDPALAKTLVFDSSSLSGLLDTAVTKVDNVEGMGFGPRLPDGDLSLVLVSDDNYRAGQVKTQFLVFDVSPDLLDVAPVPLPASLPLLGSGLAALGMVSRLARRRAATKRSFRPS